MQAVRHAVAGSVGHACPHGADRRHAAHGGRRHFGARSRERQRRVVADEARLDNGTAIGRASPCVASWTAAVRTRARPKCSSTPRPRRAARSTITRSSATRHQGLQLDQAGARARIIKLAHERGLRVSGHVPAFMFADQFVEAGADEIQHINFVFLNFFFDDVKDTRTPARFSQWRSAARRWI